MMKTNKLIGVGAALFLIPLFSSLALSWPTVYPTGVTLYNPELAFNGYTLFCPLDIGKGAEEPYQKPGVAYLLDMNGKVVHKWKLPFPPGLHARLLPNGNLVVACRSGKETPDRPGVGKYAMGGSAGWLYELDWNGKILFQQWDPTMHHDFDKLPNGNYIYVAWEKVPPELQKKVRGGIKGSEHKDGTMFNDKLVEVDPSGKVVWEWHANEAFDPDIDIMGPLHSRMEWFHCNSVCVMNDGNILIDGRYTDSMMIIDKRTKKIIWRWGSVAYMDKETGQIEFKHGAKTMGGQHDCHEIAQGLPGAGNVICYDNGMYIDESRAVEVNPKTGDVVWESLQHGKFIRTESVGRKHFSNFISGAERLPNGNTLICDGANGRFFEVTKDNVTVWEYVNPYITAPIYSGAVFRAHRYAPDYCAQFKKLRPAKGVEVAPPDNAKFKIRPKAVKKEKKEKEAPKEKKG